MKEQGLFRHLITLVMLLFLPSQRLLSHDLPSVTQPKTCHKTDKSKEDERRYYLYLKEDIMVNSDFKGSFNVYVTRGRHQRPISLSIADNLYGIKGTGEIPAGQCVGKVDYEVPDTCVDSICNTLLIKVEGTDGIMPLEKIEGRMCLTERRYLYGLTTDNPKDAVDTLSVVKKHSPCDQVEALRCLKRKNLMTRLVFDLPTLEKTEQYTDNAFWYVDVAREFSQVSQVMGCLLDSYAMRRLTVEQVRDRAQRFIHLLGDSVQVWEIGNEINGDWLEKAECRVEMGTGQPKAKQDDLPDTGKAFDKAHVMYQEAKLAQKKTAITFYFARDYQKMARSPHEMFNWIHRYVSDDMRKGLDYVWVSYYEDQNENGTLNYKEMNRVFKKLAQLFPNAKLGIGECGWGQSEERVPKEANVRAQLIKRFYGYRPHLPRFVGGCFYWHFRQTMVPQPGEPMPPDWQALNNLMK